MKVSSLFHAGSQLHMQAPLYLSYIDFNLRIVEVSIRLSNPFEVWNLWRFQYAFCNICIHLIRFDSWRIGPIVLFLNCRPGY